MKVQEFIDLYNSVHGRAGRKLLDVVIRRTKSTSPDAYPYVVVLKFASGFENMVFALQSKNIKKVEAHLDILADAIKLGQKRRKRG